VQETYFEKPEELSLKDSHKKKGWLRRRKQKKI
jgi:hypothetical protein